VEKKKRKNEISFFLGKKAKKNYYNRSSTIKDLSMLVKRDILHQKNNPDAQHLRRTKQKEEFPGKGGGVKMVTQDIFVCGVTKLPDLQLISLQI
jgi:hypothetical protein